MTIPTVPDPRRFHGVVELPPDGPPGEHGEWCRCDGCDGIRMANRHRPDDCRFDGDQRHGPG